MPNKHEQILPRGSGRISSSFNLALVGSLHLVTDEAGATGSGDRAKNPAMKSSTMKGAKALESKLCVETVPNRETLSLVDKGTLLVSCPRNRRPGLRKLWLAGRSEHRAMVRRLVLLAQVRHDSGRKRAKSFRISLGSRQVYTTFSMAF